MLHALEQQRVELLVVPWPLPDLPAAAWTALPDRAAQDRLLAAARSFWQVPDGAAILAAPGASALIARLPLSKQGISPHACAEQWMGERQAHAGHIRRHENHAR